jgi:hypothetical protein
MAISVQALESQELKYPEHHTMGTRHATYTYRREGSGAKAHE